MAGNGQINITKEILFPWRGILIQTVDPSELLPSLMQQGFFDNSQEADDLKENLQQDKLERSTLCEKLLEYLYQPHGNNVIHSFLHALKHSGYEYLDDWICHRSEPNGDINYHTDIKDENQAFRKLLELFAEPLCRKLRPDDLIPYFKQFELLLDSHVETIEKCSTHNKKVLGILNYMPLCGKRDWPVRFCKMLMEAGNKFKPYTDLALMIEPKIREQDPDDSVNEFTQANTQPQDREDATMDCIEGEFRGFTCGDGESEMMVEALPFEDSDAERNSSMERSHLSDDHVVPKRLNIEPMNDKVNNLSLTQVKTDNVSSAASVLSAEDNTAYADIGDIKDAIPLTVFEGDNFDQEAKRQRMSENDKGDELSLRPYQKELAQGPLNGFNTIIVAPTGTGKTLVAVYIAKHHLEGAVMKDCCVVFLVPYGHLVDQQEAKFRKYLPSSCSIFKLRGGDATENQAPLGSLLDSNDVVIMTPQCLVNAVNDEGPALLHHITLLFIDECHQTKKEHAYKKLMAVYLDAKLGKQNVPLPLVVGLTASIGVGTAKNEKQAEEYLFSIAANLDAQKIQTVRENEADLIQFANEAREGQVVVEGRRNDRFKKMITELMEWIETKIKRIPESDYSDDAPELRKHLLKPLGERNMQQYLNWVIPLEQLAQKVDDNKLRRIFITAKERLEVLYKGLELNDDCESQHALEYIKAKWNEQRFCPMRQLPQEKEMHQRFLDCLPELEDICLSESQANPKLSKLFDILEEEYIRSGQECRIIVFVRTRELTESLVKWVESHSSISHLKPKAIVGTAGDQTSPEQGQIVELFRNGDCQLLIATSVAEQGLDVAKCNVVIRYEYVTDEVGRVQARGRARAEDARYILITERRIGQDIINSLKEGLMGRALQSVCAMPWEDFNKKVISFQKLDWEERKITRLADSAKAKMMRMRAKEYFILRCSKCNIYACNQEDMRVVDDAHRVVISKEFDKLYRFEEAAAKKYFDGFEKKGKIYCKKCWRDWGVMFRYKQCDLPVLKSPGFAILFKNEEGSEVRMTYRYWKDIPIAIRDLAPVDLTNYLQGNADNEENEDD